MLQRRFHDGSIDVLAVNRRPSRSRRPNRSSRPAGLNRLGHSNRFLGRSSRVLVRYKLVGLVLYTLY